MFQVGKRKNRRSSDMAAPEMAMTISREQEIWAMALWVDREHGDDAEQFIAAKVLHFESVDDRGGQDLWMQVARRYVELRDALTTEPN